MYERQGFTKEEAFEKAINIQFFHVPNLTELNIKAMTPEMLALTFQQCLKPIPSSPIYKELIEAPQDFFTPAPIEGGAVAFAAKIFSTLAKAVTKNLLPKGK